MHRLTITLPDDLYAMARSKAIASRTSISKAIGELLRNPQSKSPSDSGTQKKSEPQFHPETGFPIIQCDPGITMADIQRAIDDEDVRHLEMMGLSPEEIEKSLHS